MRSPGFGVIAIGKTVRLPARLTEVAKVGGWGSAPPGGWRLAASLLSGLGRLSFNERGVVLSEVADSGRNSISRQPAPEIGVQRSSRKRGKISACSTFIKR